MSKMKLLFLAILLPTLALTQTKADTERWIVDKLTECTTTGNYNISRDDVGHTGPVLFIKNSIFGIKQGELTVHYQHVIWSRELGKLRIDASEYIHVIPLSDITGFEKYGGGDNIATMRTRSFSIKSWMNRTLNSDKTNSAQFGFNMVYDDDI